MEGKIKWYNGFYGFIEVKEASEDVFFHNSEIENSFLPSPGDEVVFEVEKTDKGLKAVDVKEAK